MVAKQQHASKRGIVVYIQIPADNFGTVVSENPTPYVILAVWAVNGLSIVWWDWFQMLGYIIFVSQIYIWNSLLWIVT